MSQYQWAKDKLKQFDDDSQQIRQEIDALYALLAKKAEARRQFQEMVEREFGEAPQAVVMQDMRMRAGIGYLDRRIEEAQQLGAPKRPHIGIGALDDPTLPPLGSPERKREMDKRNYHKRAAKERADREAMAAQGLVKKKDGGWGPRERGRGKQPRNTAENREANETIRTMIRNNVEHRVEPFSSGDLVRDMNITNKRDKQRVYQAVNALHHRGELTQIGVSATGFTYLRDGIANGTPLPPAPLEGAAPQG